MRTLLVALAALLLLGCAASGKLIETTLDPWKGAHLDEVIERLGYPDRERTLPRFKLFSWDYGWRRTIATSSFGEGYTIVGVCELTMRTSSEYIVLDWEVDRRDCSKRRVSKWARKTP